MDERTDLGERRVPSSRSAVLAWAALAAALGTVQYLARRWDAGKSPRLLDGWVQFDGPEYLSIATEGYIARRLVWFPAYPLLLGVVDRVLQDRVLAGVLVSALGGAVSAALFWRWTAEREMTRGVRWTALAVMLLYPYGWFLYGVVYSDALFLAFVLGAFVLMERDRVLAAALLGACATATRSSGYAVALGLWVLHLERSGVLRVPVGGGEWQRALRLPVSFDRSALRARSFLPLLSLAGLGAYMAYLWVRWGNPLRFMTEQARYHESGEATLLKHQYFDAWYQGLDGRHLATTTAQAVLLVAVLCLVPAVGRRFGWGYAVYVAGLALLPGVSVATFMGVGRYLLPAFPVFALVGEWLARRRPARMAWLTISAVLLFVMAAGFSRSWYLT